MREKIPADIVGKRLVVHLALLISHCIYRTLTERYDINPSYVSIHVDEQGEENIAFETMLPSSLSKVVTTMDIGKTAG